jgi:hypothetical protein
MQPNIAHAPILGRTDPRGPGDVIRGTCRKCGQPIERRPDELMWRLAKVAP